MPRVINVVMFGPLCGRWYITPVLDRGVKGGTTGFGSMKEAEQHLAKAFRGVEVLRGGDHANAIERERLRNFTGKLKRLSDGD